MNFALRQRPSRPLLPRQGGAVAGALALLLALGAPLPAPDGLSGAGSNPGAAGSSAIGASDLEREQALDLARLVLERRGELAPSLEVGDPSAPTSATLRVGEARWTPADLRSLFPFFVRSARPDDPRSTPSLTLFRTKTALEDLLAARAAEAGVDREPELARLLELRTNQVVADYYLRRHVLDRIAVTPAEIEEYYAARPDEFTEPPRVTVGLIVTETLEEAAEARRRLEGGAAFEAVASEVSIHSSRQRGGVLPPAARGSLDPELEAVAWEQAPGEVAGPVAIGGRSYLVRTIEVQPPRVRPLDEARAGIFQKLYDARRQEALEALARELLADQSLVLFEMPPAEPGEDAAARP